MYEAEQKLRISKSHSEKAEHKWGNSASEFSSKLIFLEIESLKKRR
jgi:hypothetical protein